MPDQRYIYIGLPLLAVGLGALIIRNPLSAETISRLINMFFGGATLIGFFLLLFYVGDMLGEKEKAGIT